MYISPRLPIIQVRTSSKAPRKMGQLSEEGGFFLIFAAYSESEDLADSALRKDPLNSSSCLFYLDIVDVLWYVTNID